MLVLKQSHGPQHMSFSLPLYPNSNSLLLWFVRKNYGDDTNQKLIFSTENI